MTTPDLPFVPRILAALFLLLVLGVVATTANPATLSGLVTDPSGSGIGGTTVVLHGLDSAIKQTAITTDEGYYFFVVPSGRYDLEISAASFHAFHRAELVLDAAHPSRVDAQLSLEPRAESVTVVEEGLILDPSSTEMGQELAEKKISSVPLNGRNFANLMSLQPGIVPTSSAQPNAVVMSGVTGTPPSGDLDAGNVSVSGQRETSNGFAVNDSDVEEDVNMGTAIVPNLDSIQELRVLTGNFDAQYGNYSGGQVLLTTKSGTDVFHGSGLEFLRNTNLDAKSYFSTDRAAFDRDQFGGTLGGPVRKLAIHFFADYQGTRMTEGIETGRISVPTELERTGDFSDRASSLTGAVSGPYLAGLLAQKLGYAVSSGERYYFSGCTSATQCVFPNAQIPQSAWSAPALALIQHIPQANQGAAIFSSSSGNEALRDDKGAMRIDATTRWGSFSAYYFADDYRRTIRIRQGRAGQTSQGLTPFPKAARSFSAWRSLRFSARMRSMNSTSALCATLTILAHRWVAWDHRWRRRAF